MTTVLHLPGQTDLPIMCDMSTAPDTADERMAEWRELFDQVLSRRERLADSVVLHFRAEPGRREQLEDLARREHACCPFLDLRLEAVGDELIWTTSNVVTGDHRSDIDVFLDALHDLPDEDVSDMDGLIVRLADRGVNVVEVKAGGERFELR